VEGLAAAALHVVENAAGAQVAGLADAHGVWRFAEDTPHQGAAAATEAADVEDSGGSPVAALSGAWSALR
jgi:hypothetical protein